ncbi:uncharacterized protein ASPGLDRAFT_42728 [Aspergillus glaucus CBS 516.65]|uniref:Uncharacterized protein n=1 Tax=Aspergillus glaucus CBS 516.65 TaxID=1160497 RepID=A0A1L9VUV1_ASPGL|nr:hypothetical protein ASPGLDRAFT_42728 [Aspergillus glaucus CBS 516.65]OJJ87685.1 hypothetical protein ASPGLDRAFT_42728 [Aspergillus glaucus CBS 516.65]
MVTLIHDVSNITSRGYSDFHISSSQGNSWSFGQTMPVILFAVPFVTMAELLYPEARKTVLSSTPCLENNTHDQSARHHDTEIAQPQVPLTFDPDRNYYHASSSLKAGTAAIIIAEVVLGIVPPIWIMSIAPSFAGLARFILETPLPLALLSLWCMILVSFGIDWIMSQSFIAFAILSTFTIFRGPVKYSGTETKLEPLEYRQTTEHAHYTYTAPRRGRLWLF